MKKLFMFILTVVFILSLGLVQNADATLLELEGFVNPTNAVMTDRGDGTSLLVPEPGTLALFGLGLVGLLYVRRSKTFNI